MALSDKENLEWLNNETGKSCIIQRWLKGGNNLLGEVSVGSEIKALKIYSSEQYDDRDRSGTEYKALRFLERNGCKSTPKPYLYSKVPPRLLMDWLDGEPAMSNIRDSDLVFSAEFLAFVAGASVYADDFEFDMASESCLSDQDILSHIESRILKLGHITELKPFFEQFNESLQSEITKASGFPWFSNALPKSKQTLIPADFSLHNVIRQNDGCLKVFDFEYFGWDDPVKGVADFLLHPGMTLSRADKQSFLSRAVPLFEEFDDDFLLRLEARYSLFALRWALIVLKPYLQSDASEDVKKNRLDKANKFLHIVESEFGLI